MSEDCDTIDIRPANRVAIVTGAATGIGRAIAVGMAAAGACVVIDYHTHADKAAEVVAEIEKAGGCAAAVRVDVTDLAGMQHLVDEAVRRFGVLHTFVNNAGMEKKMPFLDTPLDVWNETISVNLTGPWIGMQVVARWMVANGVHGRIINVSSVHEDLPMPTNSPYCAAKGGLRMLMRTVAVELGPPGITCNNIAPGAIGTPMDATLEKQPALMDRLLGEIPLKRMGRPAEVAGLAVFLASDAASYITGSTCFIDGGGAATTLRWQVGVATED